MRDVSPTSVTVEIFMPDAAAARTVSGALQAQLADGSSTLMNGFVSDKLTPNQHITP
eukprot:SAG31_NODE_19548_length_599_cov_0.796000_1_plen_56_part_10